MTETGWGEFEIIIKIFFVAEAAEKAITFSHHLKLHPWPMDVVALIPPAAHVEPPAATEPGEEPVAPEPPALILSPVHSWQYEEIVFSEPTETFYSLLYSRPPTALPPINRHPEALTLALGAGGNFGEFSVDMEKQEGNRLEEARLQAVAETGELKARLISHEEELIGSSSFPNGQRPC